MDATLQVLKGCKHVAPQVPWSNYTGPREGQ